MAKTKTILITSHKGGVGKTTLTAQLGMALALSGRQTLIVDCDLGMRCLDLIAGLQDDVVYDVTDVALRAVPISRAVVRDRRCERLLLLAAPYRFDGVMTADQFTAVIESAAKEIKPDFILIDAPGDTTQSLDFATKAAGAMGAMSTAFIISTHQPAAIRAAEITGQRLSEAGVAERRLIINCFDGEAVRRGKLPGVNELIDRTSIGLLGAVPYDGRISDAQKDGRLVGELGSHNAEAAFRNIAARMCGEAVPLFWGFKRIRRNALLYK